MKTLKQFDLEFEHFLDSLKLEEAGSELTEYHKAQRRAEADNDDLAFCKIYFPGIFNAPFNGLHKYIAGLSSGKYSVSGARKFGKSAFTYTAKAIKHIALGIGGIILIDLRTQDNARERTAALVRLIKRNKKLCYDYDIKIQQDKKGYYIINNTTMLASSVETGLRAVIDDDFKRVKLAICDDLYNKNSVQSDNDNQRVFDHITSEVWGQMEDDGLCIVLGNSINDKCPVVMLKDQYPENHFSLPAHDGNYNTNWEGHPVYTNDWCRKKEREIPFDVWQGEYMDSPLQKGEIFDIDWLRSVNLNTIKIIASLSAIDPSTGASPAACFKGVATLGITEERKFYVIDLYVRKEDYILVFDYVDAVRQAAPNWKVLCFENDFNQFFTAKPYYDDWSKKRNKTLPIVLHSAKELKTDYYGSDKDSRILNLVHPHQTGSFYYNDQIIKSEDYKRYRAQYISYGKSKQKLDGLDAMASAFILLPRYVERGTFKMLKERAFRRGHLYD